MSAEMSDFAALSPEEQAEAIRKGHVALAKATMETMNASIAEHFDEAPLSCREMVIVSVLCGMIGQLQVDLAKAQLALLLR